MPKGVSSRRLASWATSWPMRVILKAVFFTVSATTSKGWPLQAFKAWATTPGPETPTLMTHSGSPTPWKAPAMKGLSSTALAKTTSLAQPMGSISAVWRMILPMRATASMLMPALVEATFTLEQVKGEPFDVVAETIKKTAFKITRMGQLVAQEASRRLDVPFGVVDLSLAPTPAIGDSVAEILEIMGLEKCGGHGTTAALALLNDAVKKGGVMASSHVGGLSGAFIPVSEDAGMISAVEAGALSIDKLEAMTCVCSVGLDMIAVPGDTGADVISAIIADEAAIGMVNTKTTAVRLIPAKGKTVGDRIDFGGLLGSAPVMPLRSGSPAEFVARGGRIPAPLHSLKN